MSKTWNRCFKLESLLNKLSNFLKFKGNSAPNPPKHYHVSPEFISIQSGAALHLITPNELWFGAVVCFAPTIIWLICLGIFQYFRKMVFYFQRRVSASYKSCNAELGRNGILHSKYYLQARVEAAVVVFVLAWQSVLLRNCKTVDTLLLEEETAWQSCRSFSRLWAIQVQKLCGAF